jgi:hypothetical protein
MKPLVRAQLDDLCREGCDCGCGRAISADNPLSIAARCHFPTACTVEYWQGVLTVRCVRCGALVVKIAVKNSHITK